MKNRLTEEEARALRDRLKGKPHSDKSYAYVRAMAKLDRAVALPEGGSK